MPNIFLAPRSNETSKVNFSSIEVGRPYSLAEPYLTDEEKKSLLPHPTLRIWGTKASLRSRWEKMNKGDYVLFYAKGSFYYSARVVETKFSPELGKEIWDLDKKKEAWVCLFFVDQLTKINIPIKTVQGLAGYEPTWDRVQGFMKLRDSGTAAIIAQFGSIEAFLGQPEGVYEAIEAAVETSQEESVIGEKQGRSKAEILAKITAYKGGGPSHTISSSPKKIRVENRAQKSDVAELEDFSCQICGWFLEWTNKKGKVRYRIDVDHIVEKSEEGGEEASNLWVLCPNCHTKKTVGVITVSPKKGVVKENGKAIPLHHDHHLGWKK